MIGIYIGLVTCAIFCGTVAFVTILVAMHFGVIKLLPISHFINTVVSSLFPVECERFKDNYKESFPVVIHSKLPDKGIYLYHPHGLYTMAHISHISTKYTEWPVRNIRGTAMYTLWNCFGLGELMEGLYVPSNYSDMKKVLDAGTSLSVSIGGISEVKNIVPGKLILKISGRKGVFKLAIETGTPVVPVLVYGENELFQEYRSPLIDSMQELLGRSRILLPTIESIRRFLGIFFEPLDRPVQSIIGDPIYPVKGEDIEGLRTRYINSLNILYAKTRPNDYAKEIEYI